MPTAVEAPAVDAPRPQLWRIRDRRTFHALRHQGRRVRRGPLAVTWLAPVDQTPPRVAFAVARTAGGAVARNRVRRRLRAALRELQAAGRLPGGAYLLSGTEALAELAWAELVALVDAAVDEVTS